jgi:hypothetical protein
MATTTYENYVIGDLVNIEFQGKGTGVKDENGDPIFWQDKGASGGTKSFPAKIVSKEGPFYNVTKYEDGPDSPSTGTATVNVLQLNIAATLPVDTWIIMNSSMIGVTDVS